MYWALRGATLSPSLLEADIHFVFSLLLFLLKTKILNLQIIEANLNGELNLKIETELVCITTHFKDLGNPPLGKFPSGPYCAFDKSVVSDDTPSSRCRALNGKWLKLGTTRCLGRERIIEVESHVAAVWWEGQPPGIRGSASAGWLKDWPCTHSTCRSLGWGWTVCLNSCFCY